MIFETTARIVIIVGLTMGAYLLTHFLLARFGLRLLRRTRPEWAPIVERSRLLRLTALLVAVLTLGVAVGLLETDYPQVTELVRLLDVAAGIGIMVWMLTTTASVGLAIYERKPLAKEVPLAGFVQLVQGTILLVGVLMIVATFLGVPAIYSFTALAAIFTALGFVFQDPIMGFVAGIQLAANKMVAIGDWIQVPAYGANGTVKEILMSTVKVQNFDNTVTTVPTRSLISDSFQNWRPMYTSGGRRLQRSIYLDIHAVRPLTPALLATFPLLVETQQKIETGALAAADILVTEAGSQPTNLGLFRVYLTDYLHRHPRVNTAMMHLVHQLDRTEDGLPLEIYAFLTDTGWPQYETTASSIFEHIYAMLPQFGLRNFQRPLSIDIGDPAPK